MTRRQHAIEEWHSGCEGSTSIFLPPLGLCVITDQSEDAETSPAIKRWSMPAAEALEPTLPTRLVSEIQAISWKRTRCPVEIAESDTMSLHQLRTTIPTFLSTEHVYILLTEGMTSDEQAVRIGSLIEPTSDQERWLRNLFIAAQDEIFEDGLCTPFMDSIEIFIKRMGENGILDLAEIILDKTINAGAASEALKTIGRMTDQQTQTIRRWLLEKALDSTSSRVRDGALLGLAFLNDPLSAGRLQEAIEKEPIAELQADMKQLLTELQRS